MTTKGVILEQADRSFTHIAPHGGGANAAIKAETAAEKTFWQKSSPWVHGVLGVASFVPGLSVITGAIDAAIYTAEGDYVEAGIAAASMIPGGKVVTTVGKVAKRAVGMAKGAGTASRVGKGAHEAEELAKAAKSAKEAEEAARAAREAKVARETTPGPPKPKDPKKDVTVKARPFKVPCFHPYDKKQFMRMSKEEQKAFLKEMAEQLRRQEEAINSLTASEYAMARDAFKKMNRNPAAGAAQESHRETTLKEISKGIFESQIERGMGEAEAKTKAGNRAKELMGKLAALHEPDMVAGGWTQHKTSRIGRADVNKSIGASWNQAYTPPGSRNAGQKPLTRVQEMDREAKQAIDNGRGNQKMNVKLEPCRGKGMR
ncbi:polymorphic toxin type 15 domain-containing protein [Herbaspirillum huttiense]|uniref:Polymorphic toxin type 15 domain-containing protein n=2 Tax=Herbaspirillum huttiense TaxID=863372 RepID=A0AAJ2H7G0_9BURK|nr:MULTISPECIES: polymorphic toxin type 15 domain-containing protein [Herbaspirillum]MDR9835754.1 polymorphic toxin type 15 domain-containing protein [Herbaspirillum huttiense]